MLSVCTLSVNYLDDADRRLAGATHTAGMRAAAFVSGGALPAAVRGSTSGVRLHVVDWYLTTYLHCPPQLATATSFAVVIR